MTSLLKIATLKEEEVEQLRELEQDLDVHLMAFEPGLKAAALSDAALQRVKEMEETLNVTLLAFET